MDNSYTQQTGELNYEAHVTNEMTHITVGSLSVDAMVGHFDIAAPGVGAQFLENASTYDERYAGTLGIDISMQKIVRALERAGACGMRPSLVLDVGSGSGNSVFALAQLFPEARILASDLSPNMVTIMQNRVALWEMRDRIKVAVANASLIRPRPGHFDLILGSSMLHHLIDPFETLGTLLTGLRPGGLAVFYEPFQAGNLVVRQCLGEILRRAPYHGDVPEEFLQFVRTLVIGLDLMFEESRVHPVLPSLDDKWMFTRRQFDEASLRFGLPAPLITSTNSVEGAWANRLTALVQSGLGRNDRPPEWVNEVFHAADTNVSPALREELLMEGEIVFTKPGRGSGPRVTRDESPA